MNGEVCCILGICCPPGSQEQRNALATELVNDGVVSVEDAKKVSTWVLKHFDLAEYGTLALYRSSIIKHAGKIKKK